MIDIYIKACITCNWQRHNAGHTIVSWICWITAFPVAAPLLVDGKVMGMYMERHYSGVPKGHLGCRAPTTSLNIFINLAGDSSRQICPKDPECRLTAQLDMYCRCAATATFGILTLMCAPSAPKIHKWITDAACLSGSTKPAPGAAKSEPSDGDSSDHSHDGEHSSGTSPPERTPVHCSPKRRSHSNQHCEDSDDDVCCGCFSTSGHG